VRERGEVVDDVGRGRGERGAGCVGVAQVDRDRARARELDDLVAGRPAGVGEMAAGEPGRARDRDAPGQDAAGPGARCSAEP
jgi:hypothetical protein